MGQPPFLDKDLYRTIENIEEASRNVNLLFIYSSIHAQTSSHQFILVKNADKNY